VGYKTREAIGTGRSRVECHRLSSRGRLVLPSCPRHDRFIEPIRDETPDAYASLRAMVDVPFAIGEEFSSKWQFLPFIERGLHQFNRIDICNVGGFTEAMKVAGWSEAHYVDLMPHNPLGGLHRGAVHFGARYQISPGERVRRKPSSFDNTDFFRAAAAQRCLLSCQLSTGPWRRGQRGPGQTAKLQILGSAASEAARWFGHQLVGPA
jgi:hypothetical protein